MIESLVCAPEYSSPGVERRVGLQGARPGHLHEGRQRVDHVVGDQVAARLPGLIAAQEDLGPDLVAVRDGAWEKQALSARGCKRVGRHPEYALYAVWRCVGRGPGGVK